MEGQEQRAFVAIATNGQCRLLVKGNSLTSSYDDILYAVPPDTIFTLDRKGPLSIFKYEHSEHRRMKMYVEKWKKMYGITYHPELKLYYAEAHCNKTLDIYCVSFAKPKNLSTIYEKNMCISLITNWSEG